MTMMQHDPIEPWRLRIDANCQRRALSDDPLDGLRHWHYALVVPDPRESGPDLVVARADLYFLDPNDVEDDPAETIEEESADLAPFGALYLPGGLFNSDEVEVYGQTLLIADRVEVAPGYRGRSYGPWLLAEAIADLMAQSSIVGVLPAPYELGDPRTYDSVEYEAARDRLRALWARLGFEPEGDSIMVMVNPSVDEFRSTVLAGLRARVLSV